MASGYKKSIALVVPNTRCIAPIILHINMTFSPEISIDNTLHSVRY